MKEIEKRDNTDRPVIELLGCKAYGKGDKCPVEWCRKARGNWCKTVGTWLTLPMPNHNYLKTIAWDLADVADYQAEKKQTAIQTYSRPVADGGADLRRDPLEKARREYDEKVARGEIAPVTAIDVKAIVKGIE